MHHICLDQLLCYKLLSEFELEYDCYEDNLYERVYDHQRVPSTVSPLSYSSNGKQLCSTSSSLSSRRCSRERLSSRSSRPQMSSRAKLKMEELQTIKRELTVIKMQIDGLLDSLERMDRQRQESTASPLSQNESLGGSLSHPSASSPEVSPRSLSPRCWIHRDSPELGEASDEETVHTLQLLLLICVVALLRNSLQMNRLQLIKDHILSGEKLELAFSASSESSLEDLLSVAPRIPRSLSSHEVDLPTKPLAPTSTGNSLALHPLSLHSATRSAYFPFFLSLAAYSPSSHGTVSSISIADFTAADHNPTSELKVVLHISCGNWSCLPRSTSIFHAAPGVNSLAGGLLLVCIAGSPCLRKWILHRISALPAS
ncbi:hypothetical protein E1301_Tti018608 [Triplophysa tibetana]|uniref:Uncharacterized protein n=1 Tax=Triplophysa tibetana TaxID=1572043 RepID=A0A5A9P1I6_9TELE|nr:hypothetical protein E1301_Tti018608 [Triplophysa tibetana]